MSGREKGQFVHLHTHSDFSLLDGMAKVEAMVEAAVADGNPAIGFTDHGTMGGIIHGVRAAQKAGIQPIPGEEMYHALDRKSRDFVKGQKSNFHLLVLATNQQGYRNLMKLSSMAWIEGLYKKPRVDNDLLSQHSEGLVVTSGCLGGMVAQALLRDDRDEAVRAASELVDIFGKDRFFIEVQDHGIPDQLAILPELVWLAKHLGVGLVAGTDSHYMHPEDAYAHDALLCIQTGNQIHDRDRFRFDSDKNFLMTAAQMRALFPEDQYPGACDNTLRIAEMVDFHIDFGKEHLLPSFPLDAGFKTAHEQLVALTWEGARKFYGNDDGQVPQVVADRITYELGVIRDMGFDDYFLVLSDVIRWARKRGIMIGPGRGSAAGSAIAYCTEITGVDPLHHGLYFERFLNPGRKSMPDIDVDVEQSRRDEVLQYIALKYGKDRVAQIATYGQLKPKQAVKDSTRVLGYPLYVGESLSNVYPHQTATGLIPLSVTLEEDRKKVPENWRPSWNEGEAFRNVAGSSKKHRDVIDLALQVSNVIRQTGKHAGGLLVTPTELWNHVPVRTQSGDDNNGLYVCEYDAVDTESIGGLKIDFLGLINLSIVKETLRLIQVDLNQKIDIERIPLDDPAVFKMLCAGDTSAVFQLLEAGMTGLVVQLQPKTFDDISALLALYRPGPMASNAHVEFADRRNGRKPIKAIHPDAMDILEETAGLPVYQEQIMSIAQKFAGYSLTEADNFRKAMGKKNLQVMEAEKGRFVDGVTSNGYTATLAEQLWELIEPFCGYAFNKSHAVAYAYTSYRTAWLKAHYRTQYIAAYMSYTDRTKYAPLMMQARKSGIQVYAPDINRSNAGPSTSRDSIWLGLEGLSFLGSGRIDAIILERRTRGPFKSLGDFLVRMRGEGGDRRAILSMIHAGVFDSLHKSRKSMADNVEEMIADAKSIYTAEEIDPSEMLFDFGEGEMPTSVEGYDLDGPDYPSDVRARLELQAIGFFAGRHPFADVEPLIDQAKVQGLIPADAFPPDSDQAQVGMDNVSVYGIMTNLNVTRAKSGKNGRSNFSVETGHGSYIDAVMFGRELPAEMSGKLVVVTGRLKDSEYGDDDEESGILEMVVSDLDVPRLDSERRQARGGLTVIRGGEDQTPLRRRRRSEPAQQPVPEPEPVTEPEPEITGFRFHVTNDIDLKALRDMLAEYGRGQDRVVIRYRGTDVTHPGMMFSLPPGEAEQIASDIGVTVEAIS